MKDRYSVTIQRIIYILDEKVNKEKPRVTSKTRRLNGAINERNKLIEATVANQETHNPDGRVFVGREHGLTVCVFSLYTNGDLVVFKHSIAEND